MLAGAVASRRVVQRHPHVRLASRGGEVDLATHSGDRGEHANAEDATRRNDQEFQDRLARTMKEDREILKRLAE